jgi:hypothetical protein
VVEPLEGTGRLESIREPGKVWQVEYRFEITSTYSKKSAGGVGVRVDREMERGHCGVVGRNANPRRRIHASCRERDSSSRSFRRTVDHFRRAIGRSAC